jgi:hypothetical protein
MGFLRIAFDVIIVGALALSWVALVIHLFFSRDKSGIVHLLDWVKQQNQPAVAGVLIFAMTYFLGSAVVRVAQDFFNDDDLHIHIPFSHTSYELVTEDDIRTSVYCGMSDDWFGRIGRHFGEHPQVKPCEIQHGMRGRLLNLIQRTDLSKYGVDDMRCMKERVRNVFSSQESALLLQGQDATERLRQLHDQINVLRGAAFDALLAFSLYLFAWCATFQFPPRLRWVLLLVPGSYVVLGLIALSYHSQESAISPPLMEFTLLALGVAGGWYVWKGAPRRTAVQGENAMPKALVHTNLRAGFLLLLGLFVATAFLGWWKTEMLYDQQVIYSYYAQSQSLPN